MEDLEDGLDLRYHRGLKPDVYYRCPTLESLDGALRNEIEKNASSLIPVEIVTELVFAASSTITIPVTQQPNLDVLIEPADFLQSITVEHALCRITDGKDRMKIQRAIARSIIEAVQDADGFKYLERSGQSKEGGDGARFKYVCQDSLQNNHKSNVKKEKHQDSDDSDYEPKEMSSAQLPAYDCGGAIHIKFSIKRDAINVVYKHNPIHTSKPENDESILPSLSAKADCLPTAKGPNETKERKRKRSKIDQVAIENDYRDPDLDMSTSPEPSRASAKKKRKKTTTSASPESTRKNSAKKSKKAKETLSPTKSRKKSQTADPPAPLKSPKDKACIRCRSKKIKCNEAKPTCNQCRKGLWTCQYEVPGPKKRSKSGCINCKNRKRKCTEERPSCAYCLRNDDDCEYADF